MRLMLQELQEKSNSNQKFRAEILGKKDWKDLEHGLHYQELPHILELIQIKLIS